MTEREPILLVRIGSGLLGIPISHVREVTADATVFPMPIRLPDISHVALLRSVPHAVLNTEHYFRIEHEPRNQLVILTHQMALFIDDAVQTVHPADIQVMPKSDLLSHTRFVQAVIEYRNRIIPIIHIPEIIRDAPGTDLFPV